MPFSDYQVNRWLDDFATCYIALHYDNPEISGAYASEIFGGAYVRARASFSAPSNKVTWNTTPLNFPGLPASILTHIAAWDALVNGNYLGSMEIRPNPIRVIAGGRYDIGSQKIAFSVKEL